MPVRSSPSSSPRAPVSIAPSSPARATPPSTTASATRPVPRGIADPDGGSHGAAWCDLDNDGDLDVYILNNSFKAIGSFDLANNERNGKFAVMGRSLGSACALELALFLDN